MTFEPQNPLEKVLKRAVTEAEARPEFYRLLLETNLFIIGEIAKGTKDQLMIATVDYQGRNCHPVFSSLPRVKEFAGEDDVKYMAIEGRVLFAAAKGAHFLLNPGSECGKELRPEELANIMAQSRVMIGQPKVYPQGLVDGLKAFFATKPDVIGAYLVQIAFEGKDDPPHPLIGVEAEGDWQALSKEIGETMKTLPLDSVVDMMPIDRKQAPSGVVEALLKTTPFYKRA